MMGRRQHNPWARTDVPPSQSVLPGMGDPRDVDDWDEGQIVQFWAGLLEDLLGGLRYPHSLEFRQAVFEFLDTSTGRLACRVLGLKADDLAAGLGWALRHQQRKGAKNG